MNIKYKDLIHALLPFIAQWADSETRQGEALDKNQMSHRYVSGVLQNDWNDRLEFSKFKMIGTLSNKKHGTNFFRYVNANVIIRFASFSF